MYMIDVIFVFSLFPTALKVFPFENQFNKDVRIQCD